MGRSAAAAAGRDAARPPGLGSGHPGRATELPEPPAWGGRARGPWGLWAARVGVRGTLENPALVPLHPRRAHTCGLPGSPACAPGAAARARIGETRRGRVSPSPAPDSDLNVFHSSSPSLEVLSVPGTGLSLISLGFPCNSMIRYYYTHFAEGERGSEGASCVQEHQPVKERARRLSPRAVSTQTTSPHDAAEPLRFTQAQHHQGCSAGK